MNNIYSQYVEPSTLTMQEILEITSTNKFPVKVMYTTQGKGISREEDISGINNVNVQEYINQEQEANIPKISGASKQQDNNATDPGLIAFIAIMAFILLVIIILSIVLYWRSRSINVIVQNFSDEL